MIRQGEKIKLEHYMDSETEVDNMKCNSESDNESDCVTIT